MSKRVGAPLHPRITGLHGAYSVEHARSEGCGQARNAADIGPDRDELRHRMHGPSGLVWIQLRHHALRLLLASIEYVQELDLSEAASRQIHVVQH